MLIYMIRVLICTSIDYIFIIYMCAHDKVYAYDCVAVYRTVHLSSACTRSLSLSFTHTCEHTHTLPGGRVFIWHHSVGNALEKIAV